MAYDFVDINTRTTYLKNRLDSLSKAIQNSASFQTQEAYIAECNRVLGNFYKTISEPYFEYQVAIRDNTLSPSFNSTGSEIIEYDYNLFWQQLLDNLMVLFLEMENLEAMSIANYNFAMVELGDLTARLKSVSSKLGDYILYSQNTLKDVLLVRDSFNNLLRVDSNSSLITDKECDINQEEGIITLPIIPENNKIISVDKENITIDSTNEGAAGNNHETGTPHNGEILSISDNNPDTWFEYEKVVSKTSENVPPLVLDIGFNLKEPKVINHIVINPNNFGTKTVLTIESIDTSTDGKIYTSIKDDIPIVGYEVEDEENIFRLAPATSKYAGQGVYTFTPRKAQYVRVVLKQNEPYTISTSSGEKLRYAIGVRDIILKSLAFESKGELISKPFTVTDEIKKVMLETTQIPVVDSELTNIKYFISHNDGASWNEMQPKHIAAISGIESTALEIVDFNTTSSRSISTDNPVTSVRLKIALEREDTNFVEGSSSLAKTILTKAEVHGMPLSSPFTITLENSPIEELGVPKVEVIDPMFGSMGIPESAYMLRDGENTNEDVFYLPKEYKDMVAPWKKNSDRTKSLVPIDEWLYVYVGGEQWDHVTGEFSEHAGEAVYKISDTDQGKKIEFDSSGIAESPPDNSSIAVHFGSEQIFPSEEDDYHLAELNFKTSKTKEDLIIERYDAEVKGVKEEITVGATRFNLANKNITSHICPDGWTEKVFINGQSEFNTDDKQYSIDKRNGVLHLRFLDSGLDSITYDYQPIVELSTSDWDWTTNSSTGKQRLFIKDTGWKTQEADLFLTSAQTGGTKQLNLEYLGIIGGTLSLSNSVSYDQACNAVSFPSPFGKSVAFNNGIDEFANASDGSPQYSVDHKTGEVHFSEKLPSVGVGSFLNSSSCPDIELKYSWAKYVVKYRIARDLKLNTDYTVDVPNKQIRIKDKEFFKYLETSHMTKSGRAAHYLVNYDYVAETREHIEELKDYFTPVVKDYMLKLLRSGGVF